MLDLDEIRHIGHCSNVMSHEETVPTPFEYDLGYLDNRNPREKLGHPIGNMGLLLKYLDSAAKETNHPELAVAPLVGWLGQNGSTLCNDLWKRAPDRVIAWADSFPNWLAKFPELTANVPFPFAWEFAPKDEKDRAAEREARLPALHGKPTPPPDLKARANTYGFPAAHPPDHVAGRQRRADATS